MTKATQRRKHLIVSLLIVSEGESTIISQGREHGSRQAGRRGAGAAAERLHLETHVSKGWGSGREGLG